jgi:hypothetical protein
MTVIFENDNEVIVYAVEKIISYARRTQQIFVAQCVWWLASVIGLEQGLVNYIDNIQARWETFVVPEKTSEKRKSISPVPRDIQEDTRRDRVLKECEEILRDSKKEREVMNLKVSGRTQTGRVNPTSISKKLLRERDRVSKIVPNERKSKANRNDKNRSRIEGIEEGQIQRRKASGECLRCAWPSDRKGIHKVKDSRRPIKLGKGTASFPEEKGFRKTERSDIQLLIEEDSSFNSSTEESSDDSF